MHESSERRKEAAVNASRRPTRRVLVIGDDTRAFLTMVRSLGRMGLEVHVAPFDWGSPALCSRHIAAVHHLPRVTPHPGRWLQAVIGIAHEHDYDLIIPCCERSLLPLVAAEGQFRPGQIAHPGRATMQKLFDKLQTRKLAESVNVPVCRGRALTHSDTAESLVGGYSMPVFIKARHSYSADNLAERGQVHVAWSVEQLRHVLAGLDTPEDFLIEEGFSVGPEGAGVGVSLLAKRGRVVTAFQHRRLRQKGDNGSSSVRVSEALDAELLAGCRRMARACDLDGLAMFEFRRNRTTGAWVLLEVNARPWGSMPLAVRAGVDFPHLLYSLHMGLELRAPHGYRCGLIGTNWIGALQHLLLDLSCPVGHRLLVVTGDLCKRLANICLGRERIDEFAIDDPLPWMKTHKASLQRLRSYRLWQEQNRPERRAEREMALP